MKGANVIINEAAAQQAAIRQQKVVCRVKSLSHMTVENKTSFLFGPSAV